MKLAKLSLAAMVVAGLASSSFAADTLADAFKNGKVSGELRAWYWDRDTDAANPANYVAGASKGDASIFNTGVILGYVTDSFYGFKLGATFQSNYAPGADEDAKNLYVKDEFGSGAVLSEAYIAYTLGKTTAKVGRQFISTPLVSGSGSRMIKQSFEGALLLNTDLPQTTLAAGYVSKYQARTNLEGDVGEFEKAADFAGAKYYTFDGAYTLLAINKSITNLTLTGQYAQVQEVMDTEDVDVYHLEANYVLPLSGFKLGFDAAYRASKTDGVLAGARYNLEGSYLVGRVGVKELAGFAASFAYGQSDKSDDLVAGMGGGADNLYTNTIIRGGTQAFNANTDSYLFDASYDFSTIGVKGFKLGAQYAVNEQDKVNQTTLNRTALNQEIDYTTYNVNATYAFEGALKGLSITALYETQEKETKNTLTGGTTTADTDEVRFMANYKF